MGKSKKEEMTIEEHARRVWLKLGPVVETVGQCRKCWAYAVLGNGLCGTCWDFHAANVGILKGANNYGSRVQPKG